jgi:MYXO-CTERM domain-containing protein
MRRPLLAAAVLVPVAVVAAIATAPSGMVVDLDNFNTEATTSYVNAVHCADTPAAPALNLEWSIVDFAGGLTGAGTYQIYASNVESSEGDDASFCPEENDDTVSPNEFARSVGSVAWTSDIQALTISGSDAVAAANKSCARDGDVLFVCAHLLDASSAKKGSARGKFIVQVTAPATPTGVQAGPAGEDSLAVRWDPNASGVQVDHYVAVATPVGGGTEVRSGRTEGTEATISGLVEGTTYSVVVHAYSLGGNESEASVAVEASPAPVDDFWETYVNAGGTDDGGCASGGAGPLALLAVGSLLLLRRRR